MKLTDRCSETGANVVADGVRGELMLALPLFHGGVVDTLLRYELAGHEGAPVLLVAGGISAGRHVIASAAFRDEGWWQSQAASFDLDKYWLLSFDWIGADGSVDLPIDPADQAQAIVHVLEALGIVRLAGIVGASYGGMVGMHVATRYPERCGALLAISASAAPHPFASACRSLQRRALALGEAHDDPASGVALARAMAMLTYRTPAEFAERFVELPQVEQGRARVAADPYLDAHGNRHAGRMSAVAYRRLSESIDLHRIDPASIAVPLTLVAVDSDALVPAADIAALADAVPGATFHTIASRFGHDAFLKEDAAIGAIITDFLSSLEPTS